MTEASEKKQIISWALYDWANSAYAVTVMAGFFPLFFKQYWAADLSAKESTYQLGMANAVASLIIVVLAPVLGSIADQGGAKKKFLFLFTFLGVGMCAALFMVEQGGWQWAIAVFILATIGFSGGISFSDSLLVHVSPEHKLDTVSALGYALGYIGGGLIFALCVWMSHSPASFGIADSTTAIRLSFLLVALWWVLFAIPVFLFVPEPETKRISKGRLQAIAAGFRQLADTFREIRKLKIVVTFLLAYWLYIDGVDTIVRMAIDYGLALGLESNSLILALLITQFVGFPAAIAFGFLGKLIGPKSGIQIALGVYVFVVLWAYQMDETWEFYTLAVLIGLVQGGVQSLSRSLYARIIPANRSAEFFGFYNMLGKFAAVLGPVIMAWVVSTTGSHRLSILAISLLFVVGALLLATVNVEEGKRKAREMEV